jgi:uncharacterized repeat protein (TIGR01451 family)
MLTILQKTSKLVLVILLLSISNLNAQFRPYTQVFSQNLKGGTAIFGNTSMHVLNGSIVETTKMNETGDAANGQGGIGFSQYGNDNANMQPVNIDYVLPANLTVFNSGSSWRYNNPCTDQGTAWRTLASPPAINWVNATGSFGYGRGESVTIPSGFKTNYFLKTVNITNPASYSTFNFTYSYDDGAVVYVNGIEVKRSNMPSGTITYSTSASANNFTVNEIFSVPASSFVVGNNVIAVEIHQNNTNSGDCFFDMSLNATALPYSGPSNATSADLILPSGTNTIKFARLYWGGRIDNTVVTGAPDTLRKVKIRKGTSGTYTAALAATSSVDQYAISGSDIIYQSYVDIKSFIQSNGAGTYTLADIPCTAGAVGSGGHYAGWCIMIAYENLSAPFTSVRLYDGFAQVFNAGSPVTQLVTLTGLNVPNNPLALGDAVMSTMVWEGDANLAATSGNPAGDYIKINTVPVSNAANPVTNFWNGSISKNGLFVTTKNPNYTNQMGIDIDELQVGTGYGILPNATSVNIEFGTEADQYFPSAFGFAIRMKDPLITLDKTVTDASGNGSLESNEVLTYTLSGTNNGPGVAYNSFVVDSLPTNVTYVNNSLKIINAPGIVGSAYPSDGSGDDLGFKATNGTRHYVKFFLGNSATPTSGGELPVGATYALSFKVQTELIPGSVTNTARITANSQAGDLFTDDGTAIISPAGAPTPITLSLFSVKLQNGDGYVYWTTENELNNHYFEIERSEDGVKFSTRATVAGSGTTASTSYYNYLDKISTGATILYYRLKSVDFDGSVHYSKIIALKIKGTANDNFSVFPNPFEANIKITLASTTDKDIQCRIISFDGKEVLSRFVALTKGDNIIVLNNLEKLASGSYLLEINTGTEKLIKKIIRK